MPAGKQKPEKKDSQPGTGAPDCIVVGVGSPAGGLDALTEFLEALGEDTGMAFVLIQHPDPSQENRMGELLGKSTGMDVMQVGGPCGIGPNRVYLAPPGKFLGIAPMSPPP